MKKRYFQERLNDTIFIAILQNLLLVLLMLLTGSVVVFGQLSVHHAKSTIEFIGFTPNKEFADMVLMKEILQNIPEHRQYDRLLLTTRHLCSDCVGNAFDVFRRSSSSKNIAVIYMGENLYEVKRKNAIYRGLLNFLYVDEILMQAMEQRNRHFMWNV
jgi:hypothetical protein